MIADTCTSKATNSQAERGFAGQVLKWANILGETGLYRFISPGCLPVFMLHRVADGNDGTKGKMTSHRLRSYLEYLSDHRYQVLSMDALWTLLSERRRIPSRSVMFTIDDGFSDHHDVVAKVFDEFGFPLNFFVITSFLDRRLWPWEDQVSYAFKQSSVMNSDVYLPSGTLYSVNLEEKSVETTVREVRYALKAGCQDKLYQWLKEELFKRLQVDFPSTVPPEYCPMSWDDARALCKRGHGIFPHTSSHRILSTLSVAEKRQEIGDSIERVREELGYLPKVFAYPTGRPADYSDDDMAELRRNGVDMAFNAVPAYVQQGQDYYQLPRFSLPDNRTDFLQIVNRFEALKVRLRG